jgi:surface protein
MFTAFSFFQTPSSPVIITPFIMVVKSDNTGTSNTDQFTLTGAEVSSGTTFNVTFSPIADPTDITTVTLNVSSPTITFPSIGSYIVRVDSTTFNRIQFNSGGDRRKVLTITQWGTIAWSSMANAFRGCSNMDVTATDYPDLSNVTNMSAMFGACTTLVGTSDFNDWDTSNVTNMASMFATCTLFNRNIGGWDTSAVTAMNSMFQSAAAFNQNIGSWNTAAVTTMADMFRSTLFNQNIGGWDVSAVTTMRFMFGGNTAFNQDISGWDVSSVTNLGLMFQSQTAFNQNISGWDVSNVEDFQNMFVANPAFNQNLGSWTLKTTAPSPNMSQIFASSGMSCANYTDTIVGWANYVNTNGAPKSVNMTNMFDEVFANDRSGGAAFANSGAARTYLTGSLPDGAWNIASDTVQASC